MCHRKTIGQIKKISDIIIALKGSSHFRPIVEVLNRVVDCLHLALVQHIHTH